MLLSTAKAEPVDGGYKFTGHKMFGSLTPGVDPARAPRDGHDAIPANPKIVHAFMPRDTEGYTIMETWDTLGMRATRSDDTILDGAFVPDQYIARVVPAGFAGADLFVLGDLRLGRADVRQHLHRPSPSGRCELAVGRREKRTSVALGGRTMAYHPEIQHAVAEMALALEGAIAARRADRRGLVERRRPRRAVAGEARRDEVPRGRGRQAGRRPGDGGVRRRGHVQEPTSSSGSTATCAAAGSTPRTRALVHEIVGKTMLGVLGEEPRW